MEMKNPRIGLRNAEDILSSIEPGTARLYIKSLEAALECRLMGRALIDVGLTQPDAEHQPLVIKPIFIMTEAEVIERKTGTQARWLVLSEFVNKIANRVNPSCTIFRCSDLTLIARANPHWGVEGKFIPIVMDQGRKKNMLWSLMDVADPRDQRVVESRPTFVQKKDEYGFVLLTPLEAEALAWREPPRSREAWYHRFLWKSAREMYPDAYPRRYNTHPRMDEYYEWIDTFPGWFNGPMTPSHIAWKPEYSKINLPMNVFFPESMQGSLNPP